MPAGCNPRQDEGREQTASAPGGGSMADSWYHILGTLSLRLLAEPSHLSLTKSSPEATNPKLQHSAGIPDMRTDAFKG